MTKKVARLFLESDGQALNAGQNDDNKKVFTNPSITEFYCTVADAEAEFPEGEDKDYELVDLTQPQIDGTMPLPKRRKIPV